jgi:PilZ domain-containing protein
MSTKKSRRRVRPEERRRYPRVELLGQVTGQPLTFDSPVIVKDLSIGGFSIETSIPLRPGETHEFRFALGDSISIIVLATVVHQQPAAGRAPGRYTVGLEFLDRSDDAKAGRSVLIKRITKAPQKTRPTLVVS